MKLHIFTKNERRILEDYLTNAEVNTVKVSKILDRISKRSILFEDIYLYLRVRKTMSTS